MPLADCDMVRIFACAAPVSFGLLLMLMVAPDLPAQVSTADIVGSITDSTDAVVAGAKITATNLDTNIQRYATSNNDGNYSVLFVPIGHYKVEISSTGFKKFEQTGLVLEVNQNAHVDAVLQVGAVSETIEVKADLAMVETGQPLTLMPS